MHGQFPCGQYNDCSIFNYSLARFVEDHECVEADDGYRASDLGKVKTKSGISSQYLTAEQFDVKNRVCARHKIEKKKIKHFSSLSGIFRHNLEWHSGFVFAAMVITQISIEMSEPLFQVEYNNMA